MPRRYTCGGTLRGARTALGVLGLTFSQTALAQSHGGFALDRYRPAPSDADGFAINSAHDSGDGKWGVRLQYVYDKDPLVLEFPAGQANAEKFSIVGRHMVGHVGFFLGLADRWTLFANLPVHLAMGGTSVRGVPNADGAGLGDLALGGRVRLLGDHNDEARLAIQLGIDLPLASAAASAQSFSGATGVTFSPQVIGDVNTGIVNCALNVGGRFATATTTLLGEELQNEITAGLGVQVPVVKVVTLHGEAFGSTFVSNAFTRTLTPVEALVGAKFLPTDSLRFGVAGGLGLSRGLGSPDARVILSAGYVSAEREAPVAPPAPVDSDGDGLNDHADKCPAQPEDRDGFEDTDGCPDLDNDADKVLDAADKCPAQAEDADGFEDTDGCPDPDNDRDGIADSDDRCPNEAGAGAQQGCPIPDADHDGIADGEDACPTEPGVPELKGCAAKPLVEVTENKIELHDNVYFDPDADGILPVSFALLENVAKVLNAHPELGTVQVEGHTDNKGGTLHNQKLSEARAKAVLTFLVSHGVPAERLTSTGFGSSRPLADNNTDAGRAQNRRVAFVPQGAAAAPAPAPAPAK